MEMTKAELLEIATGLNIVVPSGALKQDILDLINSKE